MAVFLWSEIRFILALVWRRFIDDRCLRVAGDLSFTTTLSIVPLITAIIALFSMLPMYDAWIAGVENYIYQHFLPASGATVKKNIDKFTDNAAKLTSLSLLFLVVTSVTLVAAIEAGFNDIFRVAKARQWKQRGGIYLVLLFAGPLLIGAGFVFAVQLLHFSYFKASFAGKVMEYGASVLIEIMSLMFIYRVVPNCRVNWRSALVGGLFGAALLEVAKLVYGSAMSYHSAYQTVYGALAALPVFLLWIYTSWVIILLGAVVTAVYNESLQRRQARQGDADIIRLQ